MTERPLRDFSLDFFSLEGKRAIVTGGNRGLGQGYAVAMAKAGADIYIPTIADDDGTTGELVEAEGRRCIVDYADLTAVGVPADVVRDGPAGQQDRRTHGLRVAVGVVAGERATRPTGRCAQPGQLDRSGDAHP